MECSATHWLVAWVLVAIGIFFGMLISAIFASGRGPSDDPPAV